MTGSARVIRANSRSLPLADDSVDLVVTSPPYFALRSYQDGGEHYAGQIGDEPTPDAFVSSLLEVTAECVRVLKPSGSLWVNLGDKYATGASDPGAWSESSSLGGGRKRPAQTARPVSNGVARHKSLIGIPWRYALRCIDEVGLILRAEVIWSKPNGLPESVTDRVRRSHETWFHFTLSPRYFSAVDEIREAHTGNAHSSGNGPSRQWIAANGLANNHRSLATDPKDYNPLGKLPGSVWTVPTEPLRVPDHLGVDHFAAFPTEWPRRIIQGWSPAGVCVECGEGLRPRAVKEGGRPVARAHRHLPGYSDPAGEGMRDMTYRIEGYECTCRTWTPQDIASARTTALTTAATAGPTAVAAGSAPPTIQAATVLDPFGGTGTTALVAKALGRHGISVDMSTDYCRLAEWRVNDPGELAKAARKEKPPVQVAGQSDLFDLLDGDDAA